jgi:MarR family transcriptional repressor of emrRAB
MNRENVANVLGALVLALADDLARAAAESEHDPTEASALVHVGKYPGIRIDELRVPTALTHSGCVRLIDRLVARGEIQRRPGPDGRSSALHLTRKGRIAVAHHHERRKQVLLSPMATLSRHQIATLGRLASALLKARVTTSVDGLRACRQCEYAACADCPVATRLATAPTSPASPRRQVNPRPG